MSTTFDEQLLDIAYSAVAEGGPEFATAIVPSGEGGKIKHRAETREDYLSKYDIMYGELTDTRRKALRSFAILRKGMARGFRFLPPDDNAIAAADGIGKYNSGTGNVDRVAVGDGSTTTFYLIRYYSDSGTSYVRRIIKPSPYATFSINYNGAKYSLAKQEEGAAIPTTSNLSVGGLTATIYWYEGKIVFSGGAPSNGLELTFISQYHLPVAFSEDWLKFKVDSSTISEFRIALEELLPIEIGIAI